MLVQKIKQEAVSVSLPALPSGGVALITLLCVRCDKNLGVSICRARDRNSSDNTEVGSLFF